MVWGRLIEYGMLNCDQQLIVAPPEAAGQWEIACLNDNPLPDHGPELLLCNPVLLFVIADNQRILFDSHTNTLPKSSRLPGGLQEGALGRLPSAVTDVAGCPNGAAGCHEVDQAVASEWRNAR